MQVGGADGIQKLLAAEQEAQRIVSEARKGVSRSLFGHGDVADCFSGLNQPSFHLDLRS